MFYYTLPAGEAGLPRFPAYSNPIFYDTPWEATQAAKNPKDLVMQLCSEGKVRNEHLPYLSVPIGLARDFLPGGCHETQSPKRAVIEGDLYLNDAAEIPEDLYVTGSVFVREGRSVSVCPTTLKVGGNFDARCSELAQLPTMLEVGGDLELAATPISKLPESLRVGGRLDIRGTKITKLPCDMSVGRELWLGESATQTLPENLNVHGDLDLHGTHLTSLPKGLHVVGNLTLEFSSVESLPDDLWVGGSLALYNSKVYKLPETLYVGGDLYLNSPLQEAFEGFAHVHAEGIDYEIPELPAGVHVGGKVHVGEFMW